MGSRNIKRSGALHLFWVLYSDHVSTYLRNGGNMTHRGTRTACSRPCARRRGQGCLGAIQGVLKDAPCNALVDVGGRVGEALRMAGVTAKETTDDDGELNAVPS